MTGNRNIPGTGEQQGNGQFCHCIGRRTRRIFHGDTCFFRILHRNIVYADTGADDQLQPATFGLIDLRFFDFCGRANNYRIEVAQRIAQFVRLIELLYHFDSIRAQRCQCAGIHSISYQYTHNRSTFILVLFSCVSSSNEDSVLCFYQEDLRDQARVFRAFLSQVCSASYFFRKSTSASTPSLGIAL